MRESIGLLRVHQTSHSLIRARIPPPNQGIPAPKAKGLFENGKFGDGADGIRLQWPGARGTATQR